MLKARVRGKPAVDRTTAFSHGSLQGYITSLNRPRVRSYWIAAMSGFESGVDAEFFAGTQSSPIFLCNLGWWRHATVFALSLRNASIFASRLHTALNTLMAEEHSHYDSFLPQAAAVPRRLSTRLDWRRSPRTLSATCQIACFHQALSSHHRGRTPWGHNDGFLRRLSAVAGSARLAGCRHPRDGLAHDLETCSSQLISRLR